MHVKYVVRAMRLAAAVTAATLTVGALGIGGAYAGKPAPAPTGLAAQVTAHQDGSYLVSASWNATSNATSYKVALTQSGTTLSSATVTTTSWAPEVTAAPGTASLSVRAVIGHKPGRAATLSVPLLDEVAPQGSFSSSWQNDDGHATITQDSLTDNSPVADITRTVNWNDGTAPESWPIGETIDHTYPVTQKRYVPRVTLADAAGNQRVVVVPAIVINDTTPPTGVFEVDRTAGWAAYTSVSISQSSLSDNWTPAALITRSIAWGDGTSTVWTSGTTASHVYAAAGTYTPRVTITDEAHNPAAVDTSSVVVTADTVGPRMRVAQPHAKHSVRAWRTLHGRAVDAGTGVKSVRVQVVEKRGGHWYGYNATTHAWLKAATQKSAFARSRAFVRKTSATHHWSAKIRGLRKGRLLVRAWATDQVGNRSTTVNRAAVLSTR